MVLNVIDWMVNFLGVLVLGVFDWMCWVVVEVVLFGGEMVVVVNVIGYVLIMFID